VRALERSHGEPTADEAGDPPLVPVLRPGGWDLAHVAVSRSLMHPQRAPHIPFVAVARPRPKGLDFLRWPALDDLGMTWAEVLAFAIENLAATPAQWEELHRSPAFDRPALLGLSDQGVLGASRLLDRTLLDDAHARLGSRFLLASVPSQHHLFVVDGSPAADQSMLRAFVVWTARHFQAAQGIDALSERIFVVRDGVIAGLYQPPP